MACGVARGVRFGMGCGREMVACRHWRGIAGRIAECLEAVTPEGESDFGA